MTRGCPVSTSKSETRTSSRACHARFLLQMCAKDRQTHAELKLFRDYSCRETPETIDVCRSSVAPAHLPLQSTRWGGGKGGGDHKPFTALARGRRVFGWRERVAMIASLSRPMPVAGTFLEALSLLRSIPLPLVRARGAHGKTASHQPRLSHWRTICKCVSV